MNRTKKTSPESLKERGGRTSSMISGMSVSKVLGWVFGAIATITALNLLIMFFMASDQLTPQSIQPQVNNYPSSFEEIESTNVPLTPPKPSVNVFQVFLLTLVSALASGSGVLPFFVITHISNFWIGFSNACAAGIMSLASASLVYEGWIYSPTALSIGALCGYLFVKQSEAFLSQYEHLNVGGLSGADAKRALLIFGVMTFHSLSEGVGMGVSFGGGDKLGFFISLAMAVHNIPEGITVALVLIPKGVSVTQAAVWATVSALPQPLMAVPAFIFVDIFSTILPWGLGFAAGAMVTMVITEMIPEAYEELKSKTMLCFGLAISSCAMGIFQYKILDSWLES
eukprot:TRINITY_DN4078_c0_g1_i1.p1 TRINITY_DN4078_c0_g1~~TRINITY_DN4078_c0_g1_i1.p1  ORF type:complete len:341 (-),score=111.47 TRINITY_DN4078_c0_g1_i1:123-1145(-)